MTGSSTLRRAIVLLSFEADALLAPTTAMSGCEDEQVLTGARLASRPDGGKV